MDVLIKRKSYKDALDCLNDMSNESEWNIVLSSITKNQNLANFVIEYLKNIKCVFKLKLFLLKLFSANLNDTTYAIYLYNLINELCISDSKWVKHEGIRNIISIQSVKLCLLDPSQYKENLLQMLISEQTGWLLELVTKMEMNEILGDYYFNRKDFNKSLKYYKNGGLNDKVREVISLSSLSNLKTEEEIFILNKEKINNDTTNTSNIISIDHLINN